MFEDDILYTGLYWGPRERDLEQCVMHVRGLLVKLKRIDSIFGRWTAVQTQPSPEGGGREALTSSRGLARLLASGVNRRDLDRKPISALGYSMSLLRSFGTGAYVSLSITCGGSSARIRNSCIISFRLSRDAEARVLTVRTQARIINSIVEEWNPDFGVVTSYALADLVSGPNDVESLPIGWISYVSSTYDPLPPLPKSVCIEEVGTYGHLVIAKDVPLSPKRKNDVALLRQIHRAMKVKKKNQT